MYQSKHWHHRQLQLIITGFFSEICLGILFLSSSSSSSSSSPSSCYAYTIKEKALRLARLFNMIRCSDVLGLKCAYCLPRSPFFAFRFWLPYNSSISQKLSEITTESQNLKAKLREYKGIKHRTNQLYAYLTMAITLATTEYKLHVFERIC